MSGEPEEPGMEYRVRATEPNGYVGFNKDKPVEYRNLRRLLMMLAAVLGGTGAIVATAVRWPEWWWLPVGICWMVTFTTISSELDKPRRPQS